MVLPPCDVLPKTGRTHQIRVHLAHIGCPVLCDKLYGGRASITRGDLRNAPCQARLTPTILPLSSIGRPYTRCESNSLIQQLASQSSSLLRCRTTFKRCCGELRGARRKRGSEQEVTVVTEE